MLFSAGSFRTRKKTQANLKLKLKLPKKNPQENYRKIQFTGIFFSGVALPVLFLYRSISLKSSVFYLNPSSKAIFYWTPLIKAHTFFRKTEQFSRKLKDFPKNSRIFQINSRISPKTQFTGKKFSYVARTSAKRQAWSIYW